MKKISIAEDVRRIIAASANGDARMALNILEQAITMLPEDNAELNRETLSLVLESPLLQYDKKGENHYNVISAFIKSMRGSDADAALHYLARMLESGEDVKFIARRIVICAAEDVGNADPRALLIAAGGSTGCTFCGDA
jgi:putative ATPase